MTASGGDADRVRHDVNAQLAIIAGFAELMQARNDDATRIQATASIVAAVERLRPLLDELVASARVDELPAGAFSTEGTRRLLIVDDDPALRDLVRLTLPAEGFQISEAATGGEALELSATQPPDLVILDWYLPDTDGGVVLKRLRELRPELPIIVLTAAHEQRFRDQADELEATAFLTKPFSPIQLIELVEHILVGLDAV